jgi:hypothetical protein
MMPPVAPGRRASGVITFSATLAGAAAIYIIWEMRVKASKRLGHCPLTLTKEWQAAQNQRMRGMELQSAPGDCATISF